MLDTIMIQPTLCQDDLTDFHHHQVQNSLQRLRRQIPAKTTGKFHQQFEFVDGLKSKAERKKTRSFVTKQHYLRKKYIHKESQHTTNSQFNRLTADSRIASGSSRLINEQTVSSEDGDRTHLETLIKCNSGRQQQSPRLITRLGGGRIDPFSSYPVPATRDVHELVDHYYFVIPSLVHRHWHRAVRRPRACWDLFNLYRKHKVTFLGMLHHAALHLATLRGQGKSLQAIELHHRSLAVVNESLRHLGGMCDDWTLLGIGLLANAEVSLACSLPDHLLRQQLMG